MSSVLTSWLEATAGLKLYILGLEGQVLDLGPDTCVIDFITA